MRFLWRLATRCPTEALLSMIGQGQDAKITIVYDAAQKIPLEGRRLTDG